MKNLSAILNFILIIAVAYLYYLIYSGSSPKPMHLINSSNSGESIVFINSDTLLKEYNYFNDLKSKLEKQSDSIDAMLQQKGSALESEVASYQKQAPSMTQEERAQIEQKLMQKQQGIMALKEDLLGSLQQKESDMNDSVHAHLTGYLKEYNKTRNYRFILGYQRGSGILLASDSLDVTREVLKGLNDLK